MPGRLASRPSRLVRLGAPVLLCILFAASLWQLYVISGDGTHVGTDLLPRWAGTRLALHGQDPYAPDLIRKAQLPYNRFTEPFNYPATLVILLAPLAFFSPQTASLIFLCVVLPLLILSLWKIMSNLDLPRERRKRGWVLAAAFSSWAVLWGLRLEQPTLLVALLAFFTWLLLAGGHQIAPGILLALATVKPQMMLPLLLWLVLWAVARRHWAFLCSFAATLGLLLAAAERIVPGWFERWRASVRDYNGTQPVVVPMERVFGHLPGLSIAVVLAVGAGIVFWRLRRCPADSLQFGFAASLALAVALCVLPMPPLSSFDNLLLFPAILLLLFEKPRNVVAGVVRLFALGQLVLDFASVPVAVLGETISRPGKFCWYCLPFMDFLLPLLASTFLILEAMAQGSEARIGTLRPGEARTAEG
jgi:hypothetical protein